MKIYCYNHIVIARKTNVQKINHFTLLFPAPISKYKVMRYSSINQHCLQENYFIAFPSTRCSQFLGRFYRTRPRGQLFRSLASQQGVGKGVACSWWRQVAATSHATTVSPLSPLSPAANCHHLDAKPPPSLPLRSRLVDDYSQGRIESGGLVTSGKGVRNNPWQVYREMIERNNRATRTRK